METPWELNGTHKNPSSKCIWKWLLWNDGRIVRACLFRRYVIFDGCDINLHCDEHAPPQWQNGRLSKNDHRRLAHDKLYAHPYYSYSTKFVIIWNMIMIHFSLSYYPVTTNTKINRTYSVQNRCRKHVSWPLFPLWPLSCTSCIGKNIC